MSDATEPPAAESMSATAAPVTNATATPGATAVVSATTDATTSPKATIALKPLVQGLEQLTYLTYANDGTQAGASRLYLVAKSGRMLVFENGALRAQPFLDITDRVGNNGSERGLLSIAFSPRYATDNSFFVNYTDKNGNTVIARFTAAHDTNTADPASEQKVLSIDQPYPNHNGGQLQFGSDGMLYIGMGDGGSGGDPQNNGQNTQALLGKLLRIDVSQPGQPYTIPRDNPLVGKQGRPEIWAYGLRNPWRFSFDRATNDLYIADVGQNKYEEINFQPAASKGGENYGWNLYEGFEPYQDGASNVGLTMPVYQYAHDLGCSITGGYVYRGAQVTSLVGAYVYSDYCSGHIWALQRDSSGKWQNRLLLDSGLNVSSFGEDAAGELYVVSLDGAVYQIGAE
jgi:glucose/arabinose dehydrogenase